MEKSSLSAQPAMRLLTLFGYIVAHFVLTMKPSSTCADSWTNRFPATVITHMPSQSLAKSPVLCLFLHLSECGWRCGARTFVIGVTVYDTGHWCNAAPHQPVHNISCNTRRRTKGNFDWVGGCGGHWLHPCCNRSSSCWLKLLYGINVQVLCEPAAHILSVCAKFPGSANDSFILRNSSLWQKMAELADGGRLANW